MTAGVPRLAAVMGFAVLASGCVMSTDAVVAERDALLDDRLIGTWKELDGDDSAVVTRDSGNVYLIAYSSEIGTGSFTGRLGRLGGRLVMDFAPAPRGNEVPQAYENYLLPCHVLLTLEIAPDSLRIAALDRDSLHAGIESGRVRLAHGEVRSRVMLHATGDEFRAAIGPWLSQPGSLTAEAVWRRRPATISSSVP